MPSGYTAILQEKPDISFADWALQCARAFGACIMQRDDPMSEPPNMDEQPSEYHLNAMHDAQAKLNAALEMTDAELEAQQATELAATHEYARNGIEEKRKHLVSYERMLALVESWKPPTPDHEGMKKFMVDQIRESIKFDCGGTYYNEQLAKKALPVAEYRDQQIAAARRDIEYHAKGWAEEVERTNGRNQWKRQLYESLYGKPVAAK